MEAKDTVMNDEKLGDCVGGIERLKLRDIIIAEAQAEISFKAGYDGALGQLAEMTEECQQIGRREVVECVLGELDLEYLIRAKGNDITGMHVIGRLKDRLQVKRKEWGI